MTPVDYLNQVRIKKACDMIRKTGYSMEEIAVKVGFSTTSTFNRNFKRIVGTSPYHWKKSPENFETRLADFNILQRCEKGWWKYYEKRKRIICVVRKTDNCHMILFYITIR